ncbi:hypothetical protein QYH69_02645 [Paraburkholderia sp. SARCC-3016]|uniref:hypothetical protein n=1 Tax=Paraburkholderia sp. SARCC-3016 TaxID=3058611 RepID=UPI002809E334|nr:hypothetical protein [Paraburkholderia sp. SARCC-3016]MDQ7976142.1 hypothetical protein [Paraburkholderia sp. SARCC-3016]
MKKLKGLLLSLVFLTISWSAPAWCDEYLVQRLSAGQLKRGCDLSLYAIETERVAIGRPDHTVDLRWICEDGKSRIIDTYQIEGGSPQVITILFRRNRHIIVLVKWEARSRNADVFGDYYKIYAYQYAPTSVDKLFPVDRNLMSKLGEGWEGDVAGKSVHFPYKDAAAIRKALDRFGY